MRSAVRLLAAVGENVVLPVGAYALLVLAGVPAVWALVGSAAVSAVVVAVRLLRTGEVSALGVIVLARLVLAVAVAAITGDARLVLAKDAAVTAVLALGVLGTLALDRPFLARVRRDLGADPAEFDRRWCTETVFREAHRRVTAVWGVCLLAEAAGVLVVTCALPLDAAVVLGRVLSVGVLLALIGWTQWRLAGSRIASPG